MYIFSTYIPYRYPKTELRENVSGHESFKRVLITVKHGFLK